MAGITIGSDPEFLIYNREDHEFGNAGEHVGDFGDSVGCDGCDDTGELRPHYSKGPLEHASTVLSLMKRLNKKVGSEWEVRAGNIGGDCTNGNPVGGHIHFGGHSAFKCNRLDPDSDDEYPARRVVDYLDLGSLLLLDIEDKEEAVVRRSGSNYGLLGSYREQSHGFEYRTPGSWLVSPRITQGVLSLYWVLANEAVNRHRNKVLSKQVSEYRAIRQSPSRDLNLRIAFKECDRSVVGNMLDKNSIRKGVQSCALFPKYAGKINYLFKLADARKTWFESSDALHNWRLSSYKFPLYAFGGDEFLSKIKHRTRNPKVTKGSQIAVYGVKEERGEPVVVSDSKLEKVVRAFVKGEKLDKDEWRVSFGAYKEGADTQIGFGHSLREKNRDEIVKLLDAIAQTRVKG